MLFRIDPASPEPLFAQLASQVRLAAARADLQPGERLPAARDLADSLGLNVHTVLHAYQDLRDEGLIDLRRGRGAVLTERAGADYAALRAALAVVAHEAHVLHLSPETTLALLKETLA
ncbi:GntR family transcriptional regulator [Sanguibacter antarcticus]|uniref:GntR family transcriptional regulator n=1 Tax=Sanguibacter antarcticus TaxID=372484 RepID=A0A2A9E449_9MICO|nr:GntR family transcriptional regulator [Sanguibacter antarcticus]PFG33613.1 GntR family transcriptional regulator [Sanguibacter antarcticus]